MVDDISGLVLTVIPAISGLTAAVVAAIALRYNAKSFNEFRKAEELRVVEGAYRDIARNLKDFRLLEAESPKVGEAKDVHTNKVNVLLSETFADINWLCILIVKGRIKDPSLINVFKNGIIDWSYVFEGRMPDKVLDNTIFPEFKFLYRKYRHEKHKKTE